MKISKVCILGGSGFVGRHIANLLAQQNIYLRVPTRRRERAKHLIVLPTIDVNEVLSLNESELIAQFSGIDAVINLVGILHEGKGKNSFGAAHIDLAHNVVNACQKAGVKRLLHMSALNASTNAASHYLQSKGEAELIVKAAMDKLAITIFRPSVIFGQGDSFLNRFAELVKLFPILPLAKANARFQPVYVGDIAKVFINSLNNVHDNGKSYDVCGPEVFTLKELVEFVGTTIDEKPWIIPLSDGLSSLQASILEHLPGKMLTRDNLKSMELDSVCNCSFASQFGFEPTSLVSVAPAYLAEKNPRGQYQSYRRHHMGR